jgi:hypothetical protein
VHEMDPMMILTAIVTLPLIFFIPGYVTFTVFKVNKIENPKLSFFETVFLQILCSICITGWVALTLAEIGHFSLWFLSALLLSYSLLIVITFKIKISSCTLPRLKRNLETIFLILIIALAIVLFFHPSQEINLQHDIGVYINTGVNIAKTGSITIYDPILRTMPDSLRDDFYHIFDEPYPMYEGKQFPDFSIINSDLGIVLPFQPPLRQVWFAIFYSLFGLFGGLYSQPFFGLVAVLSVFLVGKSIWNWRVGAIASTLLTVNFAQVFFSQYTSPEILFQFLTFSGIATFILFLRHHNGFFGIVSAMCFGQLFMTRIDAPFILIPLIPIVFCVLLTSKQSKIYYYFIITLFVSWFHSLAYHKFFGEPYMYNLFGNIKGAYGISLTPTMVVTTLFSGSVIILILLFVTIYFKKSVILDKLRFKLYEITYIPQLLIFLTIIFIVYIWITSPSKEQSPLITTLILMPRGGMDPIVALSWFVGWFGLGLAFFGLLSMLYRKPHTKSYIFIGIVSLTLLINFYTLSNNPAFPWAMRRTIPIVIPTIMIFIGYSIDRIKDLLTGITTNNSWINKLTIILLISVLIVPSVNMDKKLIQPQYDGFVGQVDELANFFPNGSIVLESNSGYINRLSVPLKYIHNKNSIFLENGPPNTEEFVEMVKLWNQQGKNVYLIVQPKIRLDSFSKNMSNAIQFEHEATFTLNFSSISWEWYQFSNKRVEREYEVEVYRLIIRS